MHSGYKVAVIVVGVVVDELHVGARVERKVAEKLAVDIVDERASVAVVPRHLEQTEVNAIVRLVLESGIAADMGELGITTEGIDDLERVSLRRGSEKDAQRARIAAQAIMPGVTVERPHLYAELAFDTVFVFFGLSSDFSPYMMICRACEVRVSKITMWSICKSLTLMMPLLPKATSPMCPSTEPNKIFGWSEIFADPAFLPSKYATSGDCLRASFDSSSEKRSGWRSW